MAIERIRQPYELLIRYAPDGTVQGAHVQSLEVIREGSGAAAVTLAESVTTAAPVADGAAAGFPVQAAIAFLTAALPE